MRYVAVILNYKRWPDTLDTISAVGRSTLPPDRVILVDNASGAEHVDAIRRDLDAGRAPGVELLALSTNGGYATGMNAGIASALESAPDAVLMLTHDVVLESDCIERMAAELLSSPSVGISAPVLGWRGRDNVTWSGGGAIRPWTGTCWHPDMHTPLDATLRQPSHDVPWADGAALLVRREALTEAGPLPEAYFLYFEEVDFQATVREHGRRVRIAGGALAWQSPGYTPPYLATRNQLLVLRRHRRRSIPFSLLQTGAVMGKQVAKVALRRGGSLGEVRARLHGIRDGFNGRLRPELLALR
nr:glycosyltransferase family 2 protein [Motilibacter deserti]